MTRQRQLIYKIIMNTEGHLSADEIFGYAKAEMPSIALGTVYRNLSMFKAQGEIISLGTVNGVERFDGNTKSHVHYICTSCGDVQDLHQVEVPDPLQAMVEKTSGGRVDGCQLTFTGTCGECIKKQEVAV